MAKKKISFAEMKKEAISRKQEKEFESLCRRCGACCHVKVGLSDGNYIVHPYVVCKYLTHDNLCSVYDKRFIAVESKCFTREEMIRKDYILIDGCPYTNLRPGYKTAKRVTADEFDRLIVKELDLGNYNVLLANRAY
jgi:uncharacterized cysteine cluster protein YcgN (CxxCxxCC family)